MSRALSPSRAADFMQCPLLYRFRVVDKLPEPPSRAAARGTLVHEVLEQLFDLPAEERTKEAARSLVPGRWAAMLEARPDLIALLQEPTSGKLESTQAGAGGTEVGTTEVSTTEVSTTEVSTTEVSTTEASATQTSAAQTPDAAEEDAGLAALFSEAETLIERWFTLEDPTRLEPAERELYVETEVDGLTLRGYVDRLDVAPDGRLRVVDYKTGRSPSELFERKALFQMKFYALVLWRTRGVVPSVLQLVYLRDGQVLRYEPSEHDLLATERKIQALWAAIERAAHSGDWRPSTSRLCDWCHHKEVCPAFGGTPPPLPVDAQSRALDPRRSADTAASALPAVALSS